jgi:hypothetical protein
LLGVLQEWLYPVAVEDIGRMDLRLYKKALRIDQDVAFPALDLLAPVVAAFFSAHAGALHRLGIDDACTGLRVPSEANPEALADGRVELLPSAV